MDLFLASKKAAKKLKSRASNVDGNLSGAKGKKSKIQGTNSSSSETFL